MPLATIIATNDTIHKIVKDEISKYGDTADLNHIDVSKVTDMSSLFNQERMFNGDISKWDVSNVTDMVCMFQQSPFNGNISQWNVSNVKDMSYMFDGAAFNANISNWNVSSVKTMTGMFQRSLYHGDISRWDVSNVTNMSYMFKNARFNGDISQWNVSNVTSMARMFRGSAFNGNISNWELHENCYVHHMLRNAGNQAVPPLLRLDSINEYQDTLDIMFDKATPWITRRSLATETQPITTSHATRLLLLPAQAPETIHPELTREDTEKLHMLYQLTGSVYQSVKAWEQQRNTTTLSTNEPLACL